eukprot:TRINITY_DN3741_c0_g1_i1.p1 TRINITY_DN3741_c0_g1~~TRINITY_DN3741_c0_g1_i1.p1  ORF type:complete len:127 (+),score=23.84 TRINITY_DN3741_c0_g1_i1:233-613(+)
MARSNSDRTLALNTMSLEGDHPARLSRVSSSHFRNGEATTTTPDQRWFRSSATSFAKYGVYPGQGVKGMYMRDPHTGVWFKDTPERLWNKEKEVPVPSCVAKSSMDGCCMNHLSMVIQKMPPTFHR